MIKCVSGNPEKLTENVLETKKRKRERIQGAKGQPDGRPRFIPFSLWLICILVNVPTESLKIGRSFYFSCDLALSDTSSPHPFPLVISYDENQYIPFLKSSWYVDKDGSLSLKKSLIKFEKAEIIMSWALLTRQK